MAKTPKTTATNVPKKGKKLSPIEHILLRPDTYVGSIETEIRNLRVFDYENGGTAYKNVHFNNGLYNIIREIGSNCVDNKWRSEDLAKDDETAPLMKSIEMEWVTETKTLTFWNDGAFISTQKEEYSVEDYRKGTTVTEEMYPAEMYFGDVFAGTNFDDSADVVRKTSGRNGIGSKASNALSIFFRVEHTDTNNKKKFVQVYTNNAKTRTEPALTSFKGKIAYTKISFTPDFKRFGYDVDVEVVLNDFKGLLAIYAMEMAGVTALPVHFQIDGEKKVFHYKTFDKYVRMFYPDVKTNKLASLTLSNGDECVIVESHTESDVSTLLSLEEINNISFVNGSRTKDGGTHVNKWRDAIFAPFVRAFNARKPTGKTVVCKTTAKEAYPYLTLFVRTEMDKPKFDQQYKDRLNSPYWLYPEGKNKDATKVREEFKEEVEEVVKKMLKWDFVKLLEAKLTGGTIKAVKVSKRPDLGDKYFHANWAGTGPDKRPDECVYNICEGISAKAMVVEGSSAIENGQNTNGILALQGKFINVFGMSEAAVKKNKEALAILVGVNLVIGVRYNIPENFKTLNYRKKIRILTDMDDDGIHIRGLILYFFYTYWPELFEMGMIESLSTGLIKVIFKNKKKEPLIFYSQQDYIDWDLTQIDKNYTQEFSKGLAAIERDDIPRYFLQPKIVSYFSEGDEYEYLMLGFGKENKTAKSESSADKRKKWLTEGIVNENANVVGAIVNGDNGNAGNGNGFVVKPLAVDIEKIDYVYEGDYGISSFVYNQLVVYHRMSLRRALPNFIDGLKGCQRQILYGIREKKYKSPTDFERVSGAIKDITGYHHGAASLFSAMRNMTSRYPGSNNIPLLYAGGSCGTRMYGSEGKDAGAERYIKTMEEQVTKALFLAEDEPLLTRRREENKDVEYEFYLPVVNYMLMNGCLGLATGFKTEVPNFNPKDVIDWTVAWINDEYTTQPKLMPWYRGIDGPIELETKKNCWRTTGILTECGTGCKATFSHRDAKTMKIVKKKCKGEKGWWHITDLPVGYWTEKFATEIAYLESGIPPKDTARPKLETKRILDYRQFNTSNRVHFMIKPAKDWEPSIDDTLGMMTTTKSLGNMVTIDSNNYPTKHESAEDILKKWCPERLRWYGLRLDYNIALEKVNLQKANNKLKYITAVIEGNLDMYQTDSELVKCFEGLGLERIFKGEKETIEVETVFGAVEIDEIEVNKIDAIDTTNASDITKGYEYLLSMQMRSMTTKKMEELRLEITKIIEKIAILEVINPKDMWLKDIAKFEKAYLAFIKENPQY